MAHRGRRRRTRAILVGVLVAVLASAAAAAILAARAAPGYHTTAQFVTVRDGPGGRQLVRLDTTIYVPDGATAVHPAPALIGAHGFGGSKQSLAAQAELLAQEGYVVLLYSARGFGRSTGQISLDNPAYDVRDVSQLIDWLARQPEVRLDGPGDPRVGIFGVSYGAGLALLAAGYDHRIDAVAAELGWSSLGSALAPNDLVPAPGPAGGVYKQQWASLLFNVAVQPTAAAAGPGEAGTLAAAPGSGEPCARYLPAICAAYQRTAVAGRLDAAAVRLLAESSPATVLGRIRAPTLLVQGATDTLFGLDQAVANASGIAAHGTPVKMVWESGGHDGPNPPNQDQALAATALRWFDHWLRGAPGTTGPAFEWYESNTGAHGTAARYPVGTVSSLELGAGGTLIPSGATLPAFRGGARPPTTAAAVLRFDSPAGGVPAAQSSVPGLGTAGLGPLGPVDVPGQYVSFQTAPLRAAVDVVGIPTLRLRLGSTTGSAVVFAKLYDVAPDGTATLPGGVVAAIRVDHLPRSVEIRLPGIAYRFAAGDRIRLVLTSTDQAYALPRTPAAYQIALSPAAPGTLVLPALPVPPPSGTPKVVALAAVAVLVAGMLVAWLVRRRRRQARVARTVPGRPRVALTAGGSPTIPGSAPAPPTRPAGIPAVEPPAGVPVALRGLSKRFSDGLLAVDQVDLDVGPGQVLGLLGANGAGKTTTLRMLLGLIRPSTGAAWLLGEQVDPGHPVLRRVGALVEGPGFVPYLTGRRNLELNWRAGGRPLPAARLEEALEFAALGGAADRAVRTYSHGMRQRLAIAQALLGDPEVMVLDEPTDGLDPQQMAEVRELIRRLAAGGRTVLLSSHLLSEVELICSHVAIMERGRLVVAGPVADLVGDGRTVRLEVDDAAGAERALRSLPGLEVGRDGTGLVVQLDGVARDDVLAVLAGARVGVRAMVPRRRLEEVVLGLLGEEGR